MKRILTLFGLMFFLLTATHAQSKPFKDGTFPFKIFDSEYQKTTASCFVNISGTRVNVRINENFSSVPYTKNQLVYSGTLKKVNGEWYIIEADTPPVNDPEFDYMSTRIDFKRKYIIHN